MITEDYCSYEVAELLKEKGFDVPCRTWYIEPDETIGRDEPEFCNNECNKFINANDNHLYCMVSAPTHQMAMKWLREVHGFYIKIDFIIPEYIWGIIWNNNKTICVDNDDKNYRSYEEAFEASIKYCLENLV